MGISNYPNALKEQSAMCTYCGTTKYRQIYENHVGPIPKDATGRSYEIHHIDGDRNNNTVSNLIAVSLQEHYDIHFTQGDYNACRLMRIQRMDYTVAELADLNSKAKKGKVSVKDAITGELMGMISVTDERYINKELVHVSTGLKIKLAEKECHYCNKLLTVNIIRRHEKTCASNPNKVSLTNNVGSTACQYCSKVIGNTNIQKHKLTCDQNPSKTTGINHGKKYTVSQRMCSYCNQSIGATAHSRHELCCEQNPNRSFSSLKGVKKNISIKNCPYCLREIKANAFTQHTQACKLNPTKLSILADSHCHDRSILPQSP
jgi:uncharacterized Zn-finger protein